MPDHRLDEKKRIHKFTMDSQFRVSQFHGIKVETGKNSITENTPIVKSG